MLALDALAPGCEWEACKRQLTLLPQTAQSEIQTDVRANTSFSRAQRDCVVGKANVEYSPGPGEYRMESSVNAVRKASPNTKFEKSAKVCWIDEKLRYDSSVQSPGPKYDYQKSKTSRLKKPKKPKK